MTMAGGGSHECPECGEEFRSTRGVKVHHAKAHDEPLDDVEPHNSEGHECPSCDRVFDTQNAVKIHHTRTHNESIAGREVECEQCGEVERVPPSKAEGYTCCSPECQKKWQAESQSGSANPNWSSVGKELVCEWCGSLYGKEPSKATNSRFCSRECTDAWRSVAKSGENAPAWRGGYDDYYGPNWATQRQLALDRDQHRCQNCGMSEGEHIEKHGRMNPVHHITPLREFKDGDDFDYESANKLSNLITLCDDCHPKAERMAPLLPDGVGSPAD